MALASTYPGYIAIGVDPENILFGTVQVGDDFGQAKGATLKRTADKEEVPGDNGNLRMVLLKNPRYELDFETVFTLDVDAPGIGERLLFPLVGVIGNILDVEVTWQDSSARGLKITATSWDVFANAAVAKHYNGTVWSAVVDTVAIGAPVAASLRAVMAGYLNDIILTAVTPGSAGNDISFEIATPTANGQALAVAVAGQAITATPATTGKIVATGSIEVLGPIAGDWIEIGGFRITFQAGAPGGPEQCQIGADDNATAANLATAIAAAETVHGIGVEVDEQESNFISLLSGVTVPAATANAITLAEPSGGERISFSGPTMTGAVDFPITTTMAQLKTAMEASGPAAALVTPSIPAGPVGDTATGVGGGSSGIITAYPRTWLTGGAG